MMTFGRREQPAKSPRRLMKTAASGLMALLAFGCVLSAGAAENELFLAYAETGKLMFSVEAGQCSLVFHTRCLPDPEAHSQLFAPGLKNFDRHELQMNLTADEKASIAEWVERHRIFEQPPPDGAYRVATTTLMVGRGSDKRSFDLSSDADVPAVLRSAEADLLRLAFRFYLARKDDPPISPFASVLTEAGTAESPAPARPAPSRWKEPRLFHRPFDGAFADRIAFSKSGTPAALLTPVHSPNKAFYYMAVKPDFTRAGPWSTEIYLYAEKEQMTRVDLCDHAAQAPEVKWINEKLLFIRVWWGRRVGTDLVIDVETDRIVSMEMVEDGRLLFEQHAESSKALEGQESEPESGPDHDQSIADLRRMLTSGTPKEREAALDSFTEHFQSELVPDVIAAILDDTRLPRHGDTGWGTVHHYAATAMCSYAQRIDGLDQKERGRDEYSFFDEGGVAAPERRQEVHANWLKWWKTNGQEHEQLK